MLKLNNLIFCLSNSLSLIKLLILPITSCRYDIFVKQSRLELSTRSISWISSVGFAYDIKLSKFFEVGKVVSWVSTVGFGVVNFCLSRIFSDNSNKARELLRSSWIELSVTAKKFEEKFYPIS